MTTTAIPPTPELIERIQRAMDCAHEDWKVGVKATDAVKSRVWTLGFEFARVYPSRSFYRRTERAHEEFRQAEAYAEKRLNERGASFWPRGEEHSTLKEFHYDVTWAEFDGEYTDFDNRNDRQAPEHIPAFKRLVLALESELSGGPAANRPRWQVLFDFNKLLCARADLRVMVWPSDKIDEGVRLLESRLREADGWTDGHWLISGWGKDGFEHVDYHNGQRQN